MGQVIHYKKSCLHASRELGGYSLKDIGAHYGMRSSAVSQPNRGLKQSIHKDKNLNRILADIKRSIKLLNVET